MNANSLRILKNTIFLYVRMAFMVLVSLYTSRVILQSLGVDDYGIYQTVGGIVGLLSFVNSLLSGGTARFLTFELGKGVTEKLKATFSTLLSVHIGISILFVLLAEPIGLWLINAKLNIPIEQLWVAMVVFQFTVFTGFLNITQVPYTAVIIAHENMKVYAYMGLLEVFLKLGIAVAIGCFGESRLIGFAFLLCAEQVFVLMYYRFYCTRNYSESRFSKRLFDWDILKEVGSFSVWSTFAGVSMALLKYGTMLLLNVFFSPALVAARALNDQVNGTVNQFVQNFRTAANPQIVKRFAQGDYEGSRRLLLASTRLSYYLMLLISLPVTLLAAPLLQLWLVEVPDFLVIFIQWTMVQNLFSVFDTCFYTAIYAKGRLRENALLAPGIDVVVIMVVFLLFQQGFPPIIICYAFVVMAFLEGLVEKPFILCRYVDYSFKEILKVVATCLWVTVAAIPLPCIVCREVDIFQISGFLTVCLVSVVSVVVAGGFLGMTGGERQAIWTLIKNKVLKKLKG